MGQKDDMSTGVPTSHLPHDHCDYTIGRRNQPQCRFVYFLMLRVGVLTASGPCTARYQQRVHGLDVSEEAVTVTSACPSQR